MATVHSVNIIANLDAINALNEAKKLNAELEKAKRTAASIVIGSGTSSTTNNTAPR